MVRLEIEMREANYYKLFAFKLKRIFTAEAFIVRVNGTYTSEKVT